MVQNGTQNCSIPSTQELRITRRSMLVNQLLAAQADMLRISRAIVELQIQISALP